jgi:hypothetical protein
MEQVESFQRNYINSLLDEYKGYLLMSEEIITEQTIDKRI